MKPSYLKKGGQGLVGLHASFTVGDDLLNKAVSLAKKFDSGIHVHVAEDLVDQELCLKSHGKRVIERFHEAGVLDFKKTILGHCLHLDDNERDILRNSPVLIVQNTESNLNNNVGFFNPKGLNMNNIMVGTDGMHSDMLRSAKSAYFVGQTTGGVSPEVIYKRFRRVHDYIHENDFHGDDDNNLVILDYDSPTEMNHDNFFGHFIYGIDSNHIESVISNGRLTVHNKKILTVDEPEILRFSKEMAHKLWKRLQ
jgi:cytosine/adenosine deaminase-related metal-dependent hydrolase